MTLIQRYRVRGATLLIALNNSVTALMDVDIKAAGKAAIEGRRPDIRFRRRIAAHCSSILLGLGLTDAEVTALTTAPPEISETLKADS